MVNIDLDRTVLLSQSLQSTVMPLLTAAELQAELSALEAESIVWLPLGEGAYLHVGNPDEEEVVVTITGVPDVSMVGMNVVLVVVGRILRSER